MTYLIFTTGLLPRRRESSKEYEERLFKYHEERNKIVDGILHQLIRMNNLTEEK